MNSYLFEDIVDKKDGFVRGPFGGALKKEIFVEKSDDAYKVYEQGVVLNKDAKIGSYYISKEYFDLAMRRFEAKSGDILVSCSGVNYGAIYELPKNAEHGVINQALLRIRLDTAVVNSRYFIYLFESLIAKRIIGGTGDSTIPNFPPMNVVRKIPVELPCLPVQKKVAAILSALDDKIELNNRINAELEQMAKTLYDYWFVQFDFPDADGKPYKSSGGKMVYNEVLKREIPEGWEGKEVQSLLRKNGSTIKINAKEYLETGDIPIIDQSTDFIAGFTNDENSRILIRKVPAVIFGDHTRILKLINFDFARGADGTQVIFSNCPRMPQYLFYYTLSTIDLSNYGYARHFKFLKETAIILPDEKNSQCFDSNVVRLYDKILCNQKQNQELSALRDWLLPMLMNGQVKVGEAGKEYNLGKELPLMAAEAEAQYKKNATMPFKQPEEEDARFNLWLSNQGLAARGDIDTATLKAIFDAMDDEDK